MRLLANALLCGGAGGALGAVLANEPLAATAGLVLVLHGQTMRALGELRRRVAKLEER